MRSLARLLAGSVALLVLGAALTTRPAPGQTPPGAFPTTTTKQETSKQPAGAFPSATKKDTAKQPAGAFPTPAKKDAAPAKGAAPEPATPAEPAPGVEDVTIQQFEMEQRFKDPRAIAALENKFTPLFPSARALGGRETERRILAMATGEAPLDRNQLLGYVQAQVAQLTARENIEALLNPRGDTRRARFIEEAGGRLLNPLLAANQNDNKSFRSEFTRALLNVGPDVMKNHMYARLMYMVALSRAQDPAAVPFLAQTLGDANQPLAVHLLAAVGLANAANELRANPAEQIRAGKALAAFLERERGAFWPAHVRGLEALGALRQPGTDLQNPKADLEALVVSYLADPQVKLPARATAAWALGMIKPGPRPADLNFPLMAYLIGAVAAEVGTQIVALDVDPVKYPEQLAPYLDKVRRQTDLLLQLYQGFEGDPSLRDAGLLRFDHPSLARHRQMVANTAAQVRAVIAAAVALTQSAGSLVAERRAELARAVAELKAFLAQSRPDDLALYPGGPQFTVPRFEAPGGPSGRAGGRRTSAGR